MIARARPLAIAAAVLSAAAPARAEPQAAERKKKYADAVSEIEARIAERAPRSRFTILVEPPFVVVGDGPAGKVRRRAGGTVRWAVRSLKKAYFDRDPERVISIWLFQGKRSYRKHARALFGDTPSTPFGYYDAGEGALIMNIATGGGTLIHEIVHPFIEANFEDCPAWFNEGLGSLYEASGGRDGKIVGRLNWRLPGLQRAIRAGELPTFRELTGTSEAEFYGEQSGVYYAQARYLLYYLQEAGKLRAYYARFYQNRHRDPTGYRTLKEVLGEDMARFEEAWAKWVLGLRWRR